MSCVRSSLVHVMLIWRLVGLSLTALISANEKAICGAVDDFSMLFILLDLLLPLSTRGECLIGDPDGVLGTDLSLTPVMSPRLSMGRGAPTDTPCDRAMGCIVTVSIRGTGALLNVLLNIMGGGGGGAAILTLLRATLRCTVPSCYIIHYIHFLICLFIIIISLYMPDMYRDAAANVLNFVGGGNAPGSNVSVSTSIASTTGAGAMGASGTADSTCTSSVHCISLSVLLNNPPCSDTVTLITYHYI